MGELEALQLHERNLTFALFLLSFSELFFNLNQSMVFPRQISKNGDLSLQNVDVIRLINIVYCTILITFLGKLFVFTDRCNEDDRNFTRSFTLFDDGSRLK